MRAVGDVLMHSGASALSSSSVARAAGVDKALVYRYFGGFDALLTAYASSQAYWPSVAEIIPDFEELMALPFAERFGVVLRRYASALHARPATVAILAAELVDRIAVHPVLLARRESFGMEMLRLAADAPSSVDVPAIASLITGAIHYLLVRSRSVSVFNGIEIDSDDGWERIEAAVEAMARGAVLAATAAS